ncbi:MAG: hypothetical protein IJQ84_08210 [Paludibacteraceae bacterium]|nr:hypothetical protein [Paludibacteraceae bacterium]
MKKIFSLLCALTIILSASAAPAKVVTKVVSNQKLELNKAPRLEKAQLNKVAKAPQAKADETPLASGTFYTVGGTFKFNSADHTADMPSIEVAVSGANIAIVGLAYYFPEGTVTGTISGNTITIPSGQLLGSDDYGPEYLVGTNDGSTVCDIVFTYDPEEQTLEAETYYILESASATEVQPYAYWILPVFSAVKPEEPELVELPEGATVVEYTMDYSEENDEEELVSNAKTINVAVVGDQVYFQGMSAYLPEAWVVGTKEGNTITFAAVQYVGTYSGMTSFFFYEDEAIFTYDAAKDTYTAEGEIYGVLGNKYYDGHYTDPVLSKAKPIDYNNPAVVEITYATHQLTEAEEYTDVIYAFSNAKADTVFQFDIYLDKGQKDVVLGKTYTMEDMESISDYTYIAINGVATALKEVTFTKTQEEGEEIPTFKALVVDMRNNVYSFECTIEETLPEIVEVPEGLVTETYKFAGFDTYYKEDVVKFVQVGFDGADVYIQGMSGYIKEAWIKGTKNDEGIYEFPKCILGTYSSKELYTFATTMTYDAELDQFTCAKFNSEGGGYKCDEYANITLTKYVEVAATPADPEFTNFAFVGVNYPKVEYSISLKGTQNEDLNPDKLSYTFFIQKGNEMSPLVLTTDLYSKLEEDMTEIPYNFSDSYDIYNHLLYLNQDEEEVRSWDKLGLQVIYRGADEERKSNIVWYDVKAYWDEQGIENVVLTDKAQKVMIDGALYIIRNNKLYNVQGAVVK